MKTRWTLLTFLILLAFGFWIPAQSIQAQENAAYVVPEIAAQTYRPYFNLNTSTYELIQLGQASWYSQSDPGIHVYTANGEIFDETALTCASWHYPFGTLLQVTNLENHRSIVCRVNDRGPAKKLKRVIDLTKAAFQQIEDVQTGVIKVKVSPVQLR